MREIVSLHLGQAGAGVGAAFWNELREELSRGEEAVNTEVFFHQGEDGTLLPRALFADPDPESLRKVASASDWSDHTFHSGREDAASNYVRGRYLVNRMVAASLGEGLRHRLEESDSAQGLLLTYSLAGGGGSSLAAMVSEGAGPLGDDIKDLLHKKSKMAVSLFPSPRFSNSVVEPYNAVWALSELEKNTDLAIHCDNQSLYGLALDRGISDPVFQDLNNLVAEMVSSVTQGFRFYGNQNKDLTKSPKEAANQRTEDEAMFSHVHHTSHTTIASLCTALVPLPSLRHVSLHQGLGEEGLEGWTPLLDSSHHHPQANCLSSCVFYSGRLAFTDVQARVESLEKEHRSFSRTQISVHNRVKLVEEESIRFWRPTKVEPSHWRRKVCCKLSNSTSFAASLARVGANFDRMFTKRAFVHWFVGIGIEDNTFQYVRDDVRAIEQSYLEANDL